MVLFLYSMSLQRIRKYVHRRSVVFT